MGRRAVGAMGSRPRVGQQLVKFGAVQVEVGGIERSAECRLQHGDRVARSVVSQEDAGELVVRARVSARQRIDRGLKFRDRRRVVATSREQ